MYFHHISVQTGRIPKCSLATRDQWLLYRQAQSRLRQSWLRGCCNFREREEGVLKQRREQQGLAWEIIWRRNHQHLVAGCQSLKWTPFCLVVSSQSLSCFTHFMYRCWPFPPWNISSAWPQAHGSLSLSISLALSSQSLLLFSFSCLYFLLYLFSY